MHSFHSLLSLRTFGPAAAPESPPPWSRDLALQTPRNRQRPWPPSEAEGGDYREYSLPKAKAQSFAPPEGERREAPRC